MTVSSSSTTGSQALRALARVERAVGADGARARARLTAAGVPLQVDDAPLQIGQAAAWLERFEAARDDARRVVPTAVLDQPRRGATEPLMAFVRRLETGTMRASLVATRTISGVETDFEVHAVYEAREAARAAGVLTEQGDLAVFSAARDSVPGYVARVTRAVAERSAAQALLLRAVVGRAAVRHGTLDGGVYALQTGTDVPVAAPAHPRMVPSSPRRGR